MENIGPSLYLEPGPKSLWADKEQIAVVPEIQNGVFYRYLIIKPNGCQLPFHNYYVRLISS
jgi:hypothetical protein